MTSFLENFSIAECVSAQTPLDPTRPWTGSSFEGWIEESDATIDRDFAYTSWNLLTTASARFFDRTIAPDAAQKLAGLKLDEDLLLIEGCHEAIFGYFPTPLEFYLFLDEEKARTDKPFTRSIELVMAAYTLVCIDRAISALKCPDEKSAATYSIFAASAINVSDMLATEAKGASFASELGRRAAHESHSETRRLKKEVHDHWHNKIDKNLSNDDAAAMLAKHFPLKLRTLSRYVSEFKKAPSH